VLVLFKSSNTKYVNRNFYIFINKKGVFLVCYIFDFKTGIFRLILF